MALPLNPGDKVTVNFDWYPNPSAPGGGYWSNITGHVAQVDPNGQWITVTIENTEHDAYVQLSNVEWILNVGPVA
jgi:hypothetical protein